MARVLTSFVLMVALAAIPETGMAESSKATAGKPATKASVPAAPARHGTSARIAAPHAAAGASGASHEAPSVHASQGSLTGRTTLDADLQAKMLHLLDESRAPGGAIVVSDVRTGRILAWASRGPGDWVKEASTSSASVFKIATTAALLDRRKVSLSTRQCFSDTEHGIDEVDLVDSPRDIGCAPFGDALGLSINGIFARLTLKHLTPSELRSTASTIGFGGKVPADVDAPFGDFTIPDDRLGFARSSAGFWSAKLSPLGALFAMQTLSLIHISEPTRPY